MENVGYYVTAIDAGKVFPMLGPFQTKEAAEGKVKAALDKAMDVDKSGRAWFMAWGVTKITTPNALQPGKLNALKLMEVN